MNRPNIFDTYFLVVTHATEKSYYLETMRVSIMAARGEELADGQRGREREARNNADRNPTRALLGHIDAAMTPIHLERREPARNRQRFYAIAVTRTLFDQ